MSKKKNANKPKVVVIGGGTGVSVVLEKLSNEDLDLTAIVTVADDGGSSGKLREEKGTIPPGDIRNVLTALSNIPDQYKDIFQYRFKDGDDSLAGHALGNLIISAMAEMRGNFYDAVKLLSIMMRVEGKVLPSAEVPLTLHSVLVNGQTVSGEHKISELTDQIDHVYVTETETGNKAKAARGVVQAILGADLIVVGPGSLYSSILPNLVIEEVGKAVCETEAKVVYICNIMTQKGETENFSDADHVRVLHKHLDCQFIDIVLANVQPVPADYLNLAAQDENLLQVSHDFEGLMEECSRVISDNYLELRDHGVFHNGDKVAEDLVNIARDNQRRGASQADKII